LGSAEGIEQETSGGQSAKLNPVIGGNLAAHIRKGEAKTEAAQSARLRPVSGNSAEMFSRDDQLRRERLTLLERKNILALRVGRKRAPEKDSTGRRDQNHIGQMNIKAPF
jgi:hypothetical protein